MGSQGDTSAEAGGPRDDVKRRGDQEHAHSVDDASMQLKQKRQGHHEEHQVAAY
jgi:hypothetical protein